VDYVLRIAVTPVEIAPKHIVPAVTYNGQFPGPLLRFKEGRAVNVEIHNETDAPEQLHWHGQMVTVDVDGAAEEGTPFIPVHGMRRIAFTPRPSGFRFYHTHNRAGADLHAGQYSGQVGPVYIEPALSPGDYDREVFLVLKEFGPSFSQGGDMPQDFLTGTKIKDLESAGESAMKASLAKGLPQGLPIFHHKRAHARAWGTGEGKAGRASVISHSERKRHGNSQFGSSRTHVQSCRAGWQCRAPFDGSAGALARNGRTHFRHCGDESSGCLDYGRFGGR